MNDSERIEKARKKEKILSDKLFKNRTKEEQEILDNETTLGTPDNLVERDKVKGSSIILTLYLCS